MAYPVVKQKTALIPVQIRKWFKTDETRRDSIQSEQIAQASGVAWAREKALVAAGFRGQGDWTGAQRTELAASARGKVKGFAAAEIHSRNR